MNLSFHRFVVQDPLFPVESWQSLSPPRVFQTWTVLFLSLWSPSSGFAQLLKPSDKTKA